MKTLFILRHGKAEGHSPEGDFARKLTDRGAADAAKAGKEIARLTSTKPYVITSDAARALSTARIAATAAGVFCELDVDHDVYESTVDDLYRVLGKIPNGKSTALLVGHNPTLEDLVFSLAGRDGSFLGLGTASFVQMELDIDDWGAVDDSQGRIVTSWAP